MKEGEVRTVERIIETEFLGLSNYSDGKYKLGRGRKRAFSQR